MAADYRKFKTPYFEIEVGDPDWKKTVKLPHHILRLVSKIEITENMMVDAQHEPSRMVITFIEGSREPASPDYKMGTSGLYQIPLDGNQVDMSISGSLTNRSGVITDLRFSGEHGITFLTEEEKKTGKIDNRIQKNVVGKNVTRKHKEDISAPEFLFQQRNKVKVTWGYVESPETRRSMMLSIIMLSTHFPESGMPYTTVTCDSTATLLNQVAAKKAVPFTKKEVVQNDNSKTYLFQDTKTNTLVEHLAVITDLDYMVSNNLINTTVDKDKFKSIPAGESPHQFLKKESSNSGAYYEVLPNPKNGKETLLFISKKDMESRPIINDPELLRWKGPGSILKSINVTVDFTALIGAMQKKLDEKGEMQSEDIKVSERLLVQHKSSETNKKSEFLPAEPIMTNANPAVKNWIQTVFENQATGTVNYCPSDSTQKLQDSAEVLADAQSRLINIQFSTIGYPKLTNGVVEITGIGVRYSGKYKLISVTHVIDSSGYITTAQAQSSFLGTGGVKVEGLNKAKEDPLVNEELFKKYVEFKGIK